MKTETRHTPWIVDASGFAVYIHDSEGRTLFDAVRVSRHENEAIANHLVKCVNLHDELVTAVGALLLMSQFPPGPIAEAGIQRECAELLAKVKP